MQAPVDVATRRAGEIARAFSNADDPSGLQIGELPLEAVADLDAGLAVLGEGEDADAIAMPLRPMPQARNACAAQVSSGSFPVEVPIQTMTW